MIFDTLEELEIYAALIPEIKNIITVMDRSLPYYQGDGKYTVPENSKIEYIVDTALTSDSGFESARMNGKKIMEIVLDGVEIVSVEESVFRLEEGSFLVYSGEEKTKRGVAFLLPSWFKAVRFIF